MIKEEIARLLEDTYSIGDHAPSVTRVMCKDDVNFYGYFNSFSDYTDLKEKNQFRFIPRNNLKAFKEEFTKKGSYNSTYSIILNGDDIIDIEFVMPLQLHI